jgi:hypothetical protein
MTRGRLSADQSTRLCNCLVLAAGACLIVIAAVEFGSATLRLIGGAL